MDRDEFSATSRRLATALLEFAAAAEGEPRERCMRVARFLDGMTRAAETGEMTEAVARVEAVLERVPPGPLDPVEFEAAVEKIDAAIRSVR